MTRFLHTADLHLGKPFGRFPEDLRGRLREARHGAIARLAAAARAHGATHILVAGDSFDIQFPKPLRVSRQRPNMLPSLEQLLRNMPTNESRSAGDKRRAHFITGTPKSPA